jgi:hypothetical protein
VRIGFIALPDIVDAITQVKHQQTCFYVWTNKIKILLHHPSRESLIRNQKESKNKIVKVMQPEDLSDALAPASLDETISSSGNVSSLISSNFGSSPLTSPVRTVFLTSLLPGPDVDFLADFGGITKYVKPLRRKRGGEN